MEFYKRFFGKQLWEYYRIHSDGCYDYWHPGLGWMEPVHNKWGHAITTGKYVVVDKLEVLVVLGVKALGQLSFQEELEEK